MLRWLEMSRRGGSPSQKTALHAQRCQDLEKLKDQCVFLWSERKYMHCQIALITTYFYEHGQDLLADFRRHLNSGWSDCNLLFIVLRVCCVNVARVCGCVSVKVECDHVCVSGQWQMASSRSPKTKIMITVHLWRLQINPLSPAHTGSVVPPAPASCLQTDPIKTVFYGCAVNLLKLN